MGVKKFLTDISYAMDRDGDIDDAVRSMGEDVSQLLICDTVIIGNQDPNASIEALDKLRDAEGTEAFRIYERIKVQRERDMRSGVDFNLLRERRDVEKKRTVIRGLAIRNRVIYKGY
jgi:hypothetical protein